MKLRVLAAFSTLALASATLLAAPPPGADQFRLKPGAKGKVCLTCHADFEETLKLPFVHTP